jgi:hypothetical protein
VDSLDLVDLTSDKLWMRWVRGVNNSLFTSTGTIPRRAAWNDGLLLLAHGETDAGAGTGAGMVIDFTLDTIRLWRDVASIPGAFYGTTNERATGLIARRNDALGHSGSDSAWVIPDHKCRDADIYRSGGFEYHAVATITGIGMGKYQRGYTQNSPTVDTSSSTEVTEMLAVLIDQGSGELFYMDNTDVMSVTQATWEGVMATTQIFSAATTKTLPGTRDTDLQHQMVRFGSQLLVLANEGIYAVTWPGGSFSLLFGKAGSGATHEIIPDYNKCLSMALGLDGAKNVLVVGIDGVEVGLAVLDIDTNVLHGILPVEPGKSPIALAV